MKKRIHSFIYAFRGIAVFIARGANAKIQLLAAVVAIAGGLYLKLSSNEWLAVILCIGLVLSLEALNTALEELCDEIAEEPRQRIRNTKDIAAGAVLIASIASVAVATTIVIGRL